MKRGLTRHDGAREGVIDDSMTDPNLLDSTDSDGLEELSEQLQLDLLTMADKAEKAIKRWIQTENPDVPKLLGLLKQGNKVSGAAVLKMLGNVISDDRFQVSPKQEAPNKKQALLLTEIKKRLSTEISEADDYVEMTVDDVVAAIFKARGQN